MLPGVVGLFAEREAPVSRAVLADFSTQDAVDALTEEQLAAWAALHPQPAAVLRQRLHNAVPGITGPAGQASAGTTGAYLAALDAVMTQINALEQHVETVLHAHPRRGDLHESAAGLDGARRPPC